MTIRRKESEVLREVLRLLSARGIFHMRRNVGAGKNPSGQFMRFGEPGEADIIAYPKFAAECCCCKGNRCERIEPLFIECKSSEGKQSRKQLVFQRAVEASGMTYLLVKSAAEVNSWLEDNKEA